MGFLRIGLLIIVLHCSSPAWCRNMLDMSHPFSSTTRYYPGHEKFKLKNVLLGIQKRGYWLELNDYSGAEHGGTHIDAPCHFAEGAPKLQGIPLDHLVRPVVVIDISQKADTDPDCTLDVEDIVQWEKLHGQIPKGSIVIMNSGWEKHYSDDDKYFGKRYFNDSNSGKTRFEMHFPGFSAEAATWLLDNKEVVGMGTDTASLDKGMDTLFVAHRLVLGRHAWILEMVANLDKVPVKGATLWVMPMKIHNGSGAPARLVAVWGEDSDQNTNDASLVHGQLGWLILVVFLLKFWI